MVYLFSCWTAASTRFIGGNAVGLWGWLIVGLWLAYGWLMVGLWVFCRPGNVASPRPPVTSWWLLAASCLASLWPPAASLRLPEASPWLRAASRGFPVASPWLPVFFIAPVSLSVSPWPPVASCPPSLHGFSWPFCLFCGAHQPIRCTRPAWHTLERGGILKHASHVGYNARRDRVCHGLQIACRLS